MISYIKNSVARIEQRLLLLRGLRRFRAELTRDHVSQHAIHEIWLGWGNTAFSTSPELLYELAITTREIGRETVVELGGGVSSLILRLSAQQSGQRVITIESDPSWCQLLIKRLGFAGFPNAEVRYAPLRRYPEFDWYDIDCFNDLGRPGLLFIDGPPGDTRGGRGGALQLAAPLVATGGIVILDDTNRAAERSIATEWSVNYQMHQTTYRANRHRAYDILQTDGANTQGQK